MNKAVIDVQDLQGLPVAIGSAAGAPDKRSANTPPGCGPAVTDAHSLGRALLVLLQASGPATLDLGGRDIVLTRPVVLPAGTLTRTGDRRTIRNGRLLCRPGPDWAMVTQQSRASYAPGNPCVLSNVASVASIPVGALVEGAGVGREIYVTGRRPETGQITLSQPLWGAAARQDYSFTRFRYALDLAGVGGPCDLTLEDLDVQCGGIASGLCLPRTAARLCLDGCGIEDIADRGVTSIGNACAGLRLAGVRITGTGPDTVALNVNSDAAVLRGLEAEAPAILHGRHCMVEGSSLAGGLVLTAPMPAAVVTGNRFANAGLELSDECGAGTGDVRGQAGGVCVTGNLFTATDPAPEFRWILIRPHAAGLAVSRLSVIGNTFAASGTPARRIEGLDRRHADPDHVRARDVVFEGNVFTGVDQPAMNPVTLEFDQPTNATVWTLNVGDHLPFGGHARTVVSVVASGPVRSSSDATVNAMPTVRGSVGPRHSYVQLAWPEPCRGKLFVTARVDRPT